MKPKRAFIPVERDNTVRRKIISLIENQPCSAKAISVDVKIPEKEVHGHLEHIRKTLHKSDRRLVVTPAECNRCGFVFKKRDKLKKPGKCPVCCGEYIGEPLFSVTT